MQNYIDLAKRNKVTILDIGNCQFCGANTKRGVHECLEIFNFCFQGNDFSAFENIKYKFLIVDAHALQHPEIHGRWSNHFHLSRLHLIFKYNIGWNYELSPKLSNYLNKYKKYRQNEYLEPPAMQKRGNITTTDIIEISTNELECRKLIVKWAQKVYKKWCRHHDIVDNIAKDFLGQK